MSELNPSVKSALQEQAGQIWHQYAMGNKNDARTALRQVPKTRVAYVTMWLVSLATEEGRFDDAYRLIETITE